MQTHSENLLRPSACKFDHFNPVKFVLKKLLTNLGSVDQGAQNTANLNLPPAASFSAGCVCVSHEQRL